MTLAYNHAADDHETAGDGTPKGDAAVGKHDDDPADREAKETSIESRVFADTPIWSLYGHAVFLCVCLLPFERDVINGHR
jgi:hypothetical protein